MCVPCAPADGSGQVESAVGTIKGNQPLTVAAVWQVCP